MMRPVEIETHVFADAERLAHGVADWLVDLAVAKEGTFAIALSGGATPQRLYEILPELPYRDRFPWPRVQWFWGDERFVPHDDALSNYRMVRRALLSRAPIPLSNIHPIGTEGITSAAAAAAYERELKAFYGADLLEAGHPLFDVTLLGLGPDGHTASLFPNTEALRERDHWVVAVGGDGAWSRITLTYPALKSTAVAAFMVMGEEKRAILRDFCAGKDDLPATRVHPVGKLLLFSDAAAAGV